jgi:hypothetical protein
MKEIIDYLIPTDEADQIFWKLGRKHKFRVINEKGLVNPLNITCYLIDVMIDGYWVFVIVASDCEYVGLCELYASYTDWSMEESQRSPILEDPYEVLDGIGDKVQACIRMVDKKDRLRKFGVDHGLII